MFTKILAKRRVFMLNKLIDIGQATFSTCLLLALIKFNTSNLWFHYSSKYDQASYLIYFGSRLAGLWLYYLGGSAYLLALGLVTYHVPKLFKTNWSLKLDRLFGFVSMVLAANLFCQLYHIGNFGSLPGGGQLGVWLVGAIKLPKMVWLLVADQFMLIGLVLYSRLNMLPFLLPLVHKIIVFYRQTSLPQIKSNLVVDLEQSVLMQEYQELLSELETPQQAELFWGKYLGKSQTAEPVKEPVLTDLASQSINLNLDVNKISTDQNIAVVLPQLDEVAKPSKIDQKKSRDLLDEQAQVLINKLKRFGILGVIRSIKPGPVITLFEFSPAEDAKISKIIALENDLALALKTASLRIIAPVPGQAVVGFEVANLVRESVMLSDILQDKRFVKFVNAIKKNEFTQLDFQIPIAIGKDTIGQNFLLDLVKTPHLLVAGSTGAGKSVALNTILVSMLCANPPSRLRLILIDPKRLEFARYAGIGHLLFPIISDAKRTLITLRWVVREMETRYEQMAKLGVRNLADYNVKIKQEALGLASLPYLVIVIDELADLMMTAGKDVEDLIIRIAQMARAAGIHMIVATQRPSVDVVTGLIKVNFPSRISFRVASKADSRTILDCNGADTLLGAGDMLMLDAQSAALKRAHGAYVTDAQVAQVVDFILANYPTNYLNLDEKQFASPAASGSESDEILDEVLRFLRDCDEVSISLLQRRFRIGYNRSARIMDLLEAEGYVLTLDNGKMRKVLKDRLDI